MARPNNHMPDPDPIWIALAIVILAVAIALGDRRRGRFIEALSELSQDQAARRRVIAITTQNGRRREIGRHAQVAVSFLARIVAELRGTFR